MQFDIAQYIESVGKQLVFDFENARKLGADPNAKGFAIESATRKQLDALLPSVLGVGQGYVIDSYGNRSRQIDLVVYERNLCPVFSINESPEATYYPCEGVLAAVEIKSKAGKNEFMDSCEKANSVRRLQRRFNTTEDGKYINPRRYGQVELIPGASMRHYVDPNVAPVCDIFTVLVAGELIVKKETLRSYFDDQQRNSPDFFISLDGNCANFVTESNDLSNARLAKDITVGKLKTPFSLFINFIYALFCQGGTCPMESYLNYFPSSYDVDV